MEWNTGLWDIKGSQKIDQMKQCQMKAFQQTGSKVNIGFGSAFMPSYVGMHPPKAAFFSFPAAIHLFRMNVLNDLLIKTTTCRHLLE